MIALYQAYYFKLGRLRCLIDVQKSWHSALVYLAAFASCCAQSAVSVLEDLPKLNCVGVTDKIVSCLYDSLCLLLCNVSARGTEHFPNMGLLV